MLSAFSKKICPKFRRRKNAPSVDAHVQEIVIPSATISDGVGFKADKSCCNAQHNALLLSLGREKRYLYNYNTIQCMFALCVFVSRCLHGQRQYIVLYIVLYLSISIALLTACAFQSAPDHSNLHGIGVYTPKRYRQLQVKDLPKIPTWRLEQDSNPRPSGRKASTLLMHTCAIHRPT